MPFQIQTQKQSHWCWAAVASSIDKHLNPASTWDQCRVAGAAQRIPCCGHPPPMDSCDRPWRLSEALQSINRRPGLVDSPVSLETLKAEITAGYPVCARIEWNSGGGHFVVIDGFWTVDPWISVRDPLYLDQALPYETFRDSYYGLGTWTHSYLVR